MKIASIQMSVVEGDKHAAIEKAVGLVRREPDADLVILPELWNIGFMSFNRYISEAETRDGPTLTAMRDLAGEIGSFIHTGSFVEADAGRYYNSSYLLSPSGEILANYRKIHLFGFDSEEKRILTPGERVVVADTPLGKFGMATCYDLRFPELFRVMASRGAELFLVCSAWPLARLEHWVLFNRVRALENQCFLVSSDSAGTCAGTAFAGNSMVVDPWGGVLARGGEEETTITAEVNLRDVDKARNTFPAFYDRVDRLNIGG